MRLINFICSGRIKFMKAAILLLTAAFRIRIIGLTDMKRKIIKTMRKIIKTIL